MSASCLQLRDAQHESPSHPPRRSTVDHHALSHKAQAHSANQSYPPAPPRRSTSDKPMSSPSLSKASSRSFAAGVWKGRDGEDILIEAEFKRYQSCGPRSQNPDTMSNCKVRIFELVGDRFGIPTRRLAVRDCGTEEQLVSYCKNCDY